MTTHDPLKAATEELAGMHDTFKVIDMLTKAAERKLGEAEAAHNALVKARAVMVEIVAAKQQRVIELRTLADNAKAEAAT